MSSGRRRQRQSDDLVTVPSVWLEGDSPMPSTPVITAWDPQTNIVLGILFGARRDESQPVNIVNKLSGKALEVEDCSTNQAARIQQVTRNDAPNQRWLIKFTKFVKRRTIPRVIQSQATRYWPAFLPFFRAGYSVIADHSGLCLEIPNNSTDKGGAIQQFPSNGGKKQLWAFVPDSKGFNFVVNLHSGQVLDVANNSLKNYAPVQQNPFTGGDNQRWQLVK